MQLSKCVAHVCRCAIVTVSGSLPQGSMALCPVCQPATSAAAAAEAAKRRQQRRPQDPDEVSDEPASDFDLNNVDWEALEKLAVEVILRNAHCHRSWFTHQSMNGLCIWVRTPDWIRI